MADTPSSTQIAAYSGDNLFSLTSNYGLAWASRTNPVGDVQIRELLHQVQEQLFWSSFIGKGGANSLILRNDLQSNPGDYITQYQIGSDDDYPADNAYELYGQEESSTTYADRFQVGEIKHGKRWKNPKDIQLSIFNLREEARLAIENWLINKGPELFITRKLAGLAYTDGLYTNRATANNAIGETVAAPTNIMYGGSATSTGTIDNTSGMTLGLLYDALEVAKEGGTIGGTTIRKIAPTMLQTGGRGYRVVLHPRQIRALTKDPDWLDVWKMDVRGQQTQLLKGTGWLPGQPVTPFARIDDMEIYNYAGIPTVTNWGTPATVPGAIGMFLGAEAGVVGTCIDPSWREGFGIPPYNEYYMIGVFLMMGVKRLTFNSIDNGMIALYTYAKQNYTR